MKERGQTVRPVRRRLHRWFRNPYRSDNDGTRYWTAEYVELQGCKSEGMTEGEAILNLHELFDEYITFQLERGAEIPVPAKTPGEREMTKIDLDALAQATIWVDDQAVKLLKEAPKADPTTQYRRIAIELKYQWERRLLEIEEEKNEMKMIERTEKKLLKKQKK